MNSSLQVNFCSKRIVPFKSFFSRSALFQSNSDDSYELLKKEILSKSTVISWYPGHIAKAERELNDYLKNVDVIIEVRDARIPITTSHPLVVNWIGAKPHLISFSRIDQISKCSLNDLKSFFSSKKNIFFINSKTGEGVNLLKNQALQAGFSVNERRCRLGIKPRPVRAAIIGFPNVGKSALINRLIGRNKVKSQNLPGVTRTLQWVKIGNLDSKVLSLELLDSPGIIPAKHLDQLKAIKLAICNDIGEASYDKVIVASIFIEIIKLIFKTKPAYIDLITMSKRLNIEVDEIISFSGEDVLNIFATKHHNGNIISAAEKVLYDFRKGYLGKIMLEDFQDSEIQGVLKITQSPEKYPEPGTINLTGGKYDGW